MTGVAVQEIFEFSLQIPANALLFATLAALALSPVKATVRSPNGRGARDTIGRS